MLYTQITIPAYVKYLSDFVQSFPDNCLLYKGKLGCGGTTLALTNHENYIVAVPFVSLVDNKAHSIPNICPVAGEKAKWKPLVKQHLENTAKPWKFLCTYDSLEYLATTIEENGICLSEFKLLVDEYHLLFLHYAFRSKAVKSVLNNFSKFKAFCFLTATPLQEDYVLEELKHLPVISFEWEQTDTVTVKSVYCTSSVEKSTIALVHSHLAGVIAGNAHIFVNSISFINRIIDICELTDDNTKVVYSKNNKRVDVLLPRGESFTPARKINFYTSSCYEGTDLHDEDGRIYIVSDPSKEHTLVDISTSLNQITGRIRNTKYWSQVVHLYRTTRYSGFTSFEDFKADTKRIITEADEIIGEVNSIKESVRSTLECKNLYVAKEDNLFFYDPNLLKVDLFNYNVTKNLYRLQVNVRDELRSVGFNVVPDEDNSDFDVLLNPKPSLKDTIIELSELYNPESDVVPAVALQAFERYPFLKEAIKQFGYGFLVFECKGIAANIKRQLIKYSHASVEDKIRQLLHTRFKEGQFVDNQTIKTFLDKTYKMLGLKKKAKTTDLSSYFLFRKTTTKIDGKLINGVSLTKRV